MGEPRVQRQVSLQQAVRALAKPGEIWHKVRRHKPKNAHLREARSGRARGFGERAETLNTELEARGRDDRDQIGFAAQQHGAA